MISEERLPAQVALARRVAASFDDRDRESFATTRGVTLRGLAAHRRP